MIRQRLGHHLGLSFFESSPQRLLRLFHVIHRQPAGFNQMRHHRLRPSTEQSQQFVDQPGLRGIARHHGFENVRVADLLHAPHRVLRFQPINRGLDRGVRRLRGFDPASQARGNHSGSSRPAPSPTPPASANSSSATPGQPHLAGTPAIEANRRRVFSPNSANSASTPISNSSKPCLPTRENPRPRNDRARETRLKLEEPAIPGDPNSQDAGMIPPYNAYSGDGDVTAPLVYANYGLPADYDTLANAASTSKARSSSCAMAAASAAPKRKVAHERGAIGCIIYSDPRDDGYFQGDVYPNGPIVRPRACSAAACSIWLSIPAIRCPPAGPPNPDRSASISRSATIMKIPVLPISYGGRAAAARQPHRSRRSRTVARRAADHVPPRARLDATVHLNVVMDNSTRPLYDVIARIPGSDFPDQWVLDGNHHDAWVHGASDPLSGAASLMETARTLAEWFATAGSRSAPSCSRSGTAKSSASSAPPNGWRNMPTNSTGSSSPTSTPIPPAKGAQRQRLAFARSFMQEVTRDVNDPVTGKPLAARWAKPSNQDRRLPHRRPRLGFGLHAVPPAPRHRQLDIRFASDDSGIYHSDYDDFNWYSHFSDTTFVYGRTLSQVHSIALMRFADSPVLPFEFGALCPPSGATPMRSPTCRISAQSRISRRARRITRDCRRPPCRPQRATPRALPNLGSAPPENSRRSIASCSGHRTRPHARSRPARPPLVPAPASTRPACTRAMPPRRCPESAKQSRQGSR
jgi:N-acetylated-alpha-linked acidic dipeptidase